jgi:hypothetical protein
MNHLTTVALALLLGATTAQPGAAASGSPAALAGMTAATRASSKMGAPVDVYFKHLTTAKLAADPTLQISFVPRVPANLRVEWKTDAGVTIANGGSPLALGKTTANGIYTRYLTVPKGSNPGGMIRALVSVEDGDTRLFSVFVVPAYPAAAAASGNAKRQKLPVRQL